MPAPTSDTLAMSPSWVTPPAPIWAATSLTTFSATAMSALGIVKEMSVVPSFEVFCTIMSTLMFDAASGSNSAAETPGRSGTALTVTLASDTSWTTAEMIGSSMFGSSLVTQVPGSQVKLERTWRATCGCGRTRPSAAPAPARRRPAISSISSKWTWDSLRACGTSRGSAENTPVTSV